VETLTKTEGERKTFRKEEKKREERTKALKQDSQVSTVTSFKRIDNITLGLIKNGLIVRLN